MTNKYRQTLSHYDELLSDCFWTASYGNPLVLRALSVKKAHLRRDGPLSCWWTVLGLNQWPLPCQGRPVRTKPQVRALLPRDLPGSYRQINSAERHHLVPNLKVAAQDVAPAFSRAKGAWRDL